MSKNNNMFKHFFSVNYLYLIMIFFLLLFDEICANTCSDIIRKDHEWNNGTNVLENYYLYLMTI